MQSDIDGNVSGRPYRSNSGLNGGSLLHYQNNQTLELFVVTVDQFFDLPLANVDNVDLTRAIKNLPETALAGDLQAKINVVNDVPADDQFKLDQFVEQSTTSTPAALTGTDTIYYRTRGYSTNSADYFTTDFDTGLPPSFDAGGTTWTVVATHQRTITSFSGLESGSVNADLIDNDVTLTGASGTFNVYRVTIPLQASATNFFVPFGTEDTVTEINPTSLVKIDRTNVQPDFLSHIENANGTSAESARLTALENKVSTLYPLAPDVDALTNWGDIYVPERAQQEVVLTQGYDLVADYRGVSTRYESAGVTYDDTGTNVVTYTGLSESLQRIFGFKVNAPANQVLMWLVDGAERIPFIDMTAAGNYRINNYTQATVASQPTTETTFISASEGTDGVIAVGGSNAIFVIPDYPVGATATSRSASVGFDVLVNGADTQGEHFESFDIPETQEAQDRIQRTFNIFLGPLHGNRTVTVTIDYRFVVAAGPQYRFIFTLQAAPSDVTIRVQDVAVTRTYTPASTTARTDNFEIIQDELGNYTFTGENELLIAFHPGSLHRTMQVVPVAIDSVSTTHQLNDSLAPVPAHSFASVEIPDTVALTNFEFRTARVDHYLNHIDLVTLLGDRTVQWFYGKARLRTVASIHAVTEAVDFASGTTINGSGIADFSNRQLEVYQATGTGTAAGELVASVTLDADYNTYDYLIITERDPGPPIEWRHATLPIPLLTLGHVSGTDNIRLQGNTDLNWNSGTRVLSLAGGAQEIYRVVLFKVGNFVST